MAVQPLIMPKLGAYTEDVLLTEWRVEEGVEVTPGVVVFELETDKTTAEVEAETAGWLHRLVAAGEMVPIGGRVGLIAETREEYESIAGAPGGGGSDTGPGAEDADDNPFLGYIGHGGGTAVAQAAGAANAPTTAGASPCRPARLRRPGPRPVVRRPPSRRVLAPCSRSSASRSTRHERSPARARVGASSTATSPRGPTRSRCSTRADRPPRPGA